MVLILKIKTGNLQEQLKHASKDKLTEIIETIPPVSFVDEITRLIDAKNISKGELISKTLLDRNYGYQILQGTRLPSKDKVLQFTIALGCTLDETNRLLTLCQNSTWYPKIKKEALIILPITQKLTVIEPNE